MHLSPPHPTHTLSPYRDNAHTYASQGSSPFCTPGCCSPMLQHFWALTSSKLLPLECFALPLSAAKAVWAATSMQLTPQPSFVSPPPLRPFQPLQPPCIFFWPLWPPPPASTTPPPPVASAAPLLPSQSLPYVPQSEHPPHPTVKWLGASRHFFWGGRGNVFIFDAQGCNSIWTCFFSPPPFYGPASNAVSHSHMHGLVGLAFNEGILLSHWDPHLIQDPAPQPSPWPPSEILTLVRYRSPMHLQQVRPTPPFSTIPSIPKVHSYLHHISDTPPFIPVPLVSLLVPMFPVFTDIRFYATMILSSLSPKFSSPCSCHLLFYASTFVPSPWPSWTNPAG